MSRPGGAGALAVAGVAFALVLLAASAPSGAAQSADGEAAPAVSTLADETRATYDDLAAAGEVAPVPVVSAVVGGGLGVGVGAVGGAVFAYRNRGMR